MMSAKLAAHSLLARAIQKGEVVRHPCSKCGDPKSHGHHADYSKPFDVEWLCQQHHMQEHVRLRKMGIAIPFATGPRLKREKKKVFRLRIKIKRRKTGETPMWSGRIPLAVMDKIKTIAKQEDRSITQQVTRILISWLKINDPSYKHSPRKQSK